MQDLKWEIKFFKRERGETERGGMQGTSEARGRTGSCAAQQNVPVRQVDSRWNEVPTTFLTQQTWWPRGGGKHLTKEREESGLWPNRRWQTRTLTEFSVPPHPPVPFPNDSQKSLPTLSGTHCRGVARVLIISLLMDYCKGLLIGIAFFSLFSPQSIQAAATVVFLKKI